MALVALAVLVGGLAAPFATPARASVGMEEHAPQKKISWSEMQRKYEGAFVLSASRQARKVALTFDDAPDPRFTPQILDILKSKEAPATFFVVGVMAKKHPDLVKRIIREGHAIGNHSYSHQNFSRLPLSQMKEQVVMAEELICSLVSVKPRMIRPPYGEILPDQLEWAKEEGFTVVIWDVDSSDWQRLTKEEVFRNVTEAVRPGSVVLLHAGGGAGHETAEALPGIIDWLREQGYELVTLPELLNLPESRSVQE